MTEIIRVFRVIRVKEIAAWYKLNMNIYLCKSFKYG